MKNIVICCDGTGNEYGRNNTNVVETYSLVEKDRAQIAYYDPGVGTGGWEYHEEKGGLRARADQMTGQGLQRNVEDAYRRLMQCHEGGDRVYLFGFSRGAFTVRSLAGMLHKRGLLRPGHENLVEHASRIYNTEGNDDIAAGFRRTFGRDCPVEFIGVWDTVESLALNAGRKWHDHTLNPEVRFGNHALAIDERRRDFLPCPWTNRGWRKARPSSRCGSRGFIPTSEAGTRSAGCRTSRFTGCSGRRPTAACESTERGLQPAAPTRTTGCINPGPGSGRRAPAAPGESPRGPESTAASSSGGTASRSATTRGTCPKTRSWSTDLPLPPFRFPPAPTVPLRSRTAAQARHSTIGRAEAANRRARGTEATAGVRYPNSS